LIAKIQELKAWADQAYSIYLRNNEKIKEISFLEAQIRMYEERIAADCKEVEQVITKTTTRTTTAGQLRRSSASGDVVFRGGF